MTSDLDIRIADALFDAASSTPESDDALNEILRRAQSRHAGGGRRRIALVTASMAVAAVGVAAIALRPGRSAPVADDVTDVAVTPTTLPTAGTVPGPLVYDDATLLSMLYRGFDAGQADDQSRIFGSYVDQDEMARCMREAGYEHIAAPSQGETSATDPRNVMSPADFAAQYGFGVAAEALGLLPPEFGVADPNWDYRNSLSPAAQEVYDRASGYCIEEQAEMGLIVITDQAWIAAHDYAWEQFEPIVMSDDRAVSALAAWRECMAGAGFDYEDPAMIASTFGVRLHDFAPWDFPVEPGTPEYADIEQIMTEEVAVASANAPCVEPYTATLRDVILDRYDEYKSIFEAALDAGVESGGVGFSS